ncbi:MAG: nucleoside phosphorylase [Nitrososphaerota archaeon]|nr:nucleoside phosphorylase [Nitrososphaerota archaeon]MDG7018992.1 nucleoside phosphorylase [Nitrososphaerota archaeon]MDG7028133.1 nucleoside phosphorylase [Nitrososphaerota archaeon]
MAHQPTDKEGRPYHVRLSKADVGRVALLPGDPGRVPLIAQRLDGARELNANREYVAYGGKTGGEKVLVMSTGIGGPSTAIAVEELARLGVEVMIRVGTCGAIQPSLKLGSLVIADSAVRMDGTSRQYVMEGYPAAATPGVVLALAEAAASLGRDAAVGVAASTDSFYVGQGREGFGGYLPPDKARIVEDLRAAKVLCFEMEASTLFTLGRLFGLKTGAVFAVVANRATDELGHGVGVDDAIEVALAGVRGLKKRSI